MPHMVNLLNDTSIKSTGIIVLDTIVAIILVALVGYLVWNEFFRY